MFYLTTVGHSKVGGQIELSHQEYAGEPFDLFQSTRDKE
jgi:hypothetical protein